MRVFLSYSHGDRDVAQALVSRLSRAGVDVWWDGLIDPGDNYARRIGDALDGSDAMVILLSPSYLRSEHSQRELDFALAAEKYEHRVVPIVVRPTRVPWILEKLHPVRWYKDPKEGGKQVVRRVRELAGEAAK
jgi:hypothetical protein